MLEFLTAWAPTRSIANSHRLRIYSHIGLMFAAVALLLSTSIVLAYSIKIYYGTFLHAIPELLTVSCVTMVVVALAWVPSNEYPGAFGLDCMRYVWQELVWSCALSLGIIGGLMSLHQSTPGLMTNCGRFFICRGYIFIFVSAWFSWFLISVPTVYLLASVLYQKCFLRVQIPVWGADITRYEYFWPDESCLDDQRWSVNPLDEVPHIQHGVEELKMTEPAESLSDFEKAEVKPAY